MGATSGGWKKFYPKAPASLGKFTGGQLTDLEETMRIKIDLPSPTQAVLTPNGRMDVESSPVVRQAILNAWNKGAKSIIIDLSEVDFMDSSGLSALVSGMKALRKTGGKLMICNANAQIRTAMRLTMLDRVFPIFDTIEEALSNTAK
jgi:anti-sigma B factor antagonist